MLSKSAAYSKKTMKRKLICNWQDTNVEHFAYPMLIYAMHEHKIFSVIRFTTLLVVFNS